MWTVDPTTVWYAVQDTLVHNWENLRDNVGNDYYFLGLIGLVVLIFLWGGIMQYRDLKGRYKFMKFIAKGKDKELIANILSEGLEKACKEGKISLWKKRRLYIKVSYILQLPDHLVTYHNGKWLDGVKHRIRYRLENGWHKPVKLPDGGKDKPKKVVTFKRSSKNVAA